MKSNSHFSAVRAFAGLALFLALAAALPAQSALTAGDVAIIGWVDNGSPDGISFVTLAPVQTGTVLYFTDNGWNGATFRGYPTVGLAGNEGVTKWTATADVPVGTVVNSYSGAFGTWTTNGAIATATGSANAFSQFNLSQTGDQVYCFQASNPADPIGSITTHLFVLDDTGAFETATNSNQGDAPATLTVGTTALTFAQSTTGLNFMGFNAPAGLQASGADKATWLAAIANSANWTFSSAGLQPSGQLNVLYAAPTVTADPQSTTVCLGAPATFSVTVDGGGIFYQWKFNNNPISGANSASYTIASTTLADQGAYVCDVVNNLGGASSNPGNLTIDAGPAITADPQSQTVTAGQPVTFSVTVSGIGPFTYQWRKDTNTLIGETNATLTISSTVVGDAGTYDVVVANGCGQIISNGGVLTVTPVTTPGAGQPFSAEASMDINNALNANGNAVGNIGDENGPYFATASAATGIHLSFSGEANQPIVLIFGDLNPGAADFSFVGIGKIDVGTINNAPPFIPGGIQIVVDGTATDVLSSFFHIGPTGFVDFTFPAFLPPGIFGTFQAVIYNSGALFGVVASNAVELTIV